MNWRKIDAHALYEVAYEGRCPAQPDLLFWLWKNEGQWRASCSGLEIVGEILTQGATPDEEAQQKAVRFFSQVSLVRAGRLLALGQHLGSF